MVEGAQFCGECGNNFSSQTAQPAATPTPAPTPRPQIAAPVAERRLVTVLFADLVGFTTIAEGKDPEQVRELLTRYFETAREVVSRYGGTIEKFIGDAVMAVWGAPTAHEDDAERAVRAALDLVEAVDSLGTAKSMSGLAARAGVLTGEAAVTLGAEGQGMVAGDMVNTAARLQSVAAPGTVVVGQTTYDAASMAISFEEVGEQTLKGKTLPVPAWRALRVVGRRGGAGRYVGLEPPFEGRDEDLRLIKALFHATGRERRARLVSIIGQAGTGKSRLIREFEKYIDGLTEVVYWHVGRSPSYGEGITFWALGEMVRKRAGLAERDDDETTRAGISAVLDQFVPDEADRHWVEPRLQQLLGVGDAHSSEREELFGAWRMFFERVAEKGPVVMAFEGLESADTATLDFIDYVVEWSRSHPIFILALTRPELLERRPGMGAGQRNYTAIGLEPLTDDAMRRAVAGLVPGLPPKAVKAIVSRAEGVPLYAVETVRMLLNEGRLAEHDGVYEPVGDLTELEIPNTLHALIAARLDALAGPDRATLQEAAVLGTTFSTAALVAVSGASADDVQARLHTLVKREMLELNADPRSPERGQYAFVQGLVREVAYATLSKRDRRLRHLAAARYFETLGDDELAGALAMHYLDAWKAAPEGPEGDAVAAQARVALRAAAERATALHSPVQALSYLEHLLAVTTNPAERARALERAAASAERAALADKGDRYATEAMSAYRELADLGGLARAAAILVRGHQVRARITEGLAVGAAVLAEVEASPDDPGVVELTATVARLEALGGDQEAAIRMADRALIVAERLNLVEIIAGAVMTKGVALAYMQRNLEALILLPGVLLLAESKGLIEIEARARLNISFFQLVDEPTVAMSVARVGVERAQKFGLREWEILLGGNAVMAALHTGDWDWALTVSAEVMRDSSLDWENNEIDGHPAVIAGLRGDRAERLERNIAVLAPNALASTDTQYRALLGLLRGWLGVIRGDLRPVADYVSDFNLAEPTYSSHIHALGGHVALWLGDRSAAERNLQLLRQLNVHGSWIDASRNALVAGIAALDGQTAEATAGFAESARTLREHGMPLDTALVLMDEVATVGVDEPAGRAAADEAREILTKLGATVLVDHLDRLVSAPLVPPAPAVEPALVSAGVEATA